MKLLALSLIGSNNISKIEVLWEILGDELSISFGREAGSAAIWMFTCLLVRLALFKVEFLVPLGIIFAFPYFIQKIYGIFPFMKSSLPLLLVRLAETILGRISPTKLAVIIPAHFLGSIFGIVLFKTVFFFLSAELLAPIQFEDRSSIFTFIFETILVFLYTSAWIGVPEILVVNHLPANLLTWVCTPLLLFPIAIGGSSFNPAAVYALSYVHGSASQGHIPSVHLIAPAVGAILAGTFCSKFFPDDPTSWRRIK